MLKRIIAVTVIISLIAVSVLLYKLFWPSHYHVIHLKERTGTKYWNLLTGSKIAYTFIEGKGIKKPYPLIYLHGGPGSGITDLQIETLRPLANDGYDIYVYDQIGSGHSERLNDIREYTADRHKKDLEEIVHAIGSDKVILIAQSWGCILAVLFYADNPEKVAKLAITASGPLPPAQMELAAILPPDSLNLREPYFSNRDANIKTDNLRTRAILFWMSRFGKKLASDEEADEFITHLTNELNKAMVCDTSKAVRAEGTEGFYSHYMTRMSLAKVEDPRTKVKGAPLAVLVMKGECDNQKWGFTNEFLELFPNHQLVVVPNAGHNIFVEQPVLYTETIRKFINEQ